MSPRLSLQKQLVNYRQFVIAVGIIVLVIFAIKYGKNQLRYRQLQEESAIMDQHIAAVQQEKKSIEEAFDASISPGEVEKFAHEKLNWVKEGDEVIVTLPEGMASGAPEAAEAGGRASAPVADQKSDRPKANWELWLDLVLHGRPEPANADDSPVSPLP